MNKEKLEVTKEKLGVDEWLELIREDKNLNGAYISICQYVDLTEQENKQLKDNWDELKEDLIKIRQLTFTKYNKNEWANCLSFNDDILPLIKKMQEIEQGKCYENRINNLENDLIKYEKENKWLKDIINSILHI